MTDHAEEAETEIQAVESWLIKLDGKSVSVGEFNSATVSMELKLREAQAHATLALAREQHIANAIAILSLPEEMIARFATAGYFLDLTDLANEVIVGTALNVRKKVTE